ncbi:putative glycosyl transferase [Pseudobythopirellula maris]|uniref:Putative glycosyl transferase n=1 Tax=Pseudobythopirellula maris TaxID=2527991 RepID=A0A5C5ZMY7_9BACT|nr:glycosyltransferase family 4 protein [Pseudobythopirellula maris]TWT88842.1 putative glycosyl transferase [Pseudobythopirellula maris]
MPKRNILFISQVYVPDPTSVGQHMADAAEELAARGYRVRVITSGRGYDDPTQRYPARETLGGVDVVRLPFSSLGKKSILHRVAGQLMFLVQAILRGWFGPRPDKIVVSTSPPMAAIAALAVRLVRRSKIVFWAMDLNPDQVIATGVMKPTALPVKMLNWLNRWLLGAVDHVVALDPFMAERLNAKRDVSDKTTVFPPWPHNEPEDDIPKSENPFVAEHGLADKFVVMYSGNHGLTTPLDSLVDAALTLQDDPRLRFMFIGGGPGKAPVTRAIEEHQPENIVSLPYQPLDAIRYSLSSADIHVVLMNEALVGIVHPCKVYGAMTVGRPVLYFGPRPSHVTELLDAAQAIPPEEGGGPIGWEARPGDVEQTAAVLREIAATPPEEIAERGRRAKQLIAGRYSKKELCGRFADIVVEGLDTPE